MSDVSQPGNNACAGLSSEDREEIGQLAKIYVDGKSIVVSLTEIAGNIVKKIGGSLYDVAKEKLNLNFSESITQAIETALWSLQSGVIFTLTEKNKGDPWNWFHKILTIASGAGAGFVGLPGLLWDLPVTTMLMMRSIADIAQSHDGENLHENDTKRACIEVLAFGGPDTDDDSVEIGYWSVRSSLSHLAIDALIKSVAGRYSVVISEEAIAKAVPIIGAFAGGGLNYIFMDYYQEMARVHFGLRRMERKLGGEEFVRPCFDHQVQQIRAARHIGRNRK